MEDAAALETTWLIGVLLALALVALGLAAYGWQRSRRRRPGRTPATPDRDQELDLLGISGVRPRGAARLPSPPARPAFASEDASEETLEGEPEPPADEFPDVHLVDEPPAETLHEALRRGSGEEAVAFDETGVSAPRPVAALPPEEPPSEPPPVPTPYAAMRSPLWHVADPDAVGFLLESLCTALGAQSVALLRYDEATDTYAVDALVGRRLTPRTDPFPAEDNALHRVPDDRSISLLEADALGALRYHAHPERAAGHAAALTVEDPAHRVLLVADAAAGAPPFSARHLSLLGDYADLLGRLLAEDGPAEPADEPAEEPAEPPAIDEEPVEPTDEASPALAPLAAVEGAPVRLRADIIAEEMAAARTSERPLALALVVLRDTEAIEGGGRGAVADAEAALFERLRKVEGSARVEQFGELLAGVFCHAGPTFVETWAERVAASGPPVHVGVALLRARHLDAAALRADAAAALRAAYERDEDCVILE